MFQFRKLGKINIKQVTEEMLGTPMFKQIFLTPLANEKAKAKALEKLLQQHPDQAKSLMADMKQKKRPWEKVWLEVKEEETLNQEEQKSRKEKMNIIEELDNIRSKVDSGYMRFRF